MRDDKEKREIKKGGGALDIVQLIRGWLDVETGVGKQCRHDQGIWGRRISNPW